LQNHAIMKQISQQRQIATANIALEKSKLLPDFSVGYNNVSIKGTGADDKVYGSDKRFNSVQVGIGIPIFAKAQKEKVNSAKFIMQIAESNYAVGLQQLQSEYNKTFTQYNKYKQTVQYFESTALKNADLIASTANKQLANGSINYLEWTQMIAQSTMVKSDYVEVLKNFNEAIIQLNYFNN